MGWVTIWYTWQWSRRRVILNSPCSAFKDFVFAETWSTQPELKNVALGSLGPEPFSHVLSNIQYVCAATHPHQAQQLSAQRFKN